MLALSLHVGLQLFIYIVVQTIVEGAAYFRQRPSERPCLKTRVAAMAWSCVREVAQRDSGNSKADDTELLSALLHALNLTQMEQLADLAIAAGAEGIRSHDPGMAKSSPAGYELAKKGMTTAYVDVHSNRHGSNCGVMLFSERHQRPCSDVLRFHEVNAAVMDWERSLLAGTRPKACSPAVQDKLCLDMEESLNTFELGWILALKADLIRVNAYKPWPFDLFAKYDLVIFRVDELRLLQPVSSLRHPQLRLVVGTEPHIYADTCDFRYRAFNDLTEDSCVSQLEALGICPVILDPFLIQMDADHEDRGPPGLPHWWPMPLHIYRAAFPLDLSDGRGRDRRILFIATPNPHYTPTHRRSCVRETSLEEVFSTLSSQLPPEDGSGNGWQYFSNTLDWSMWDFWQQLKAAKYVVLLPFARQSLGRSIAEAAAVAAVPVIGWRNKLFMRILMPPLLSVESVTQIAETILHLEANPSEYDSLRHAIVARLRFVQPTSILHANELAQSAQILGRGHRHCNPWSSQLGEKSATQAMSSTELPNADTLRYHDPLEEAVYFACVLLCRRACPTTAKSTKSLIRAKTFCDSAPGPDWHVRGGEFLGEYKPEQAVQEVAWWSWQASPLQGAALAILTVALVQMAQQSGDDPALALFFFRLAERALYVGGLLRAEAVPDVQLIIDGMLFEGERMVRLRNLTARAWGRHLQKEGMWSYDVDRWVRKCAATFWPVEPGASLRTCAHEL